MRSSAAPPPQFGPVSPMSSAGVPWRTVSASEAPPEMRRDPPLSVRRSVSARLGVPLDDLRWVVVIFIPESPDAWNYQGWLESQESSGLAALNICNRQTWSQEVGGDRLCVADRVLARTGKPLLTWRVNYFSAAAQQ